MRRPLIVIVAIVVVVWLRTAFYTVDTAEFVYVTRFGDPVARHDGATTAGLHIKAPWPVDAVIRIDRRVQSFDLPAVEVLTRDPNDGSVDKTIAVDAYVTWRIPNVEAADRFVKSVRTPEQAKKILGPLINGRLAALISTMPLSDLIGAPSTQLALAGCGGGLAWALPEPWFRADDLRQIEERTERVRRRLIGDEGLTGGSATAADDLRTKVLTEYGIDIIDIRIRRFSYPEAVRSSIADRIREERKKKATDYESEAQLRKADITTDAEREAAMIIASAQAQKTIIEGQASAEAARIRAAAYAQDRDFYLFLESLRTFQMVVAKGTDTILLSTKHPLFRALQGPPEGMKKDK